MTDALKKRLKYYEEVPENVKKPCKQFRDDLKKIRRSMKRTEIVAASKVILFYVPIVSRAGTDIGAALQKLKDWDGKHVALVVLHHTFDRESVVPDSSRAVNREKTITVDCLFHEDEGLLKCQKNDDAVKKVAEWLKVVKNEKVRKDKPKKDNGKNMEMPVGGGDNGGPLVS